MSFKANKDHLGYLYYNTIPLRAFKIRSLHSILNFKYHKIIFIVRHYMTKVDMCLYYNTINYYQYFGNSKLFVIYTLFIHYINISVSEQKKYISFDCRHIYFISCYCKSYSISTSKRT